MTADFSGISSDLWGPIGVAITVIGLILAILFWWFSPKDVKERIKRFFGYKPKTQKRNKDAARLTTKNIVTCPNCRNSIEPRRIGKLIICPVCSFEFKSAREKIKEGRELIKGIKEVKDLLDE